MKLKETVYIAGKISGLTYNLTYIKFWLREMLLKLYGYKPINPMREVPKSWTYNNQMQYCLLLEVTCKHIYLSGNWYNSPGARAELRQHLRTGRKSIIYSCKYMPVFLFHLTKI